MANSARFGFPLEYTRDIQATKRFFTDVLGLELDRDHPTFVQFRDAGGAAYAIASDEPMDRGDVPELWWTVDDAEQACAARVETDLSSDLWLHRMLSRLSEQAIGKARA